MLCTVMRRDERDMNSLRSINASFLRFSAQNALQVGVGLALEGPIPSCVEADERSFSQKQADTPKHI